MSGEDSAPSEMLSLHEAADRLGLHYMTVYRHVRTGRLAATKVGGVWQVNAADLPDGRSAGSADPPDPSVPRTDRTRRRLESRLLVADESGAWKIIEEALTGGAEPTEIHLELLGPAMRSIGERWAAGEITVAREHLATAVAQRIVGRLGPMFVTRGRRRGTVIIGAPPGDHHALPSYLFSDIVRSHGYEVACLGADTPADSFALAATDDVVAVCVSCTTPDNDDHVRAALEAIRRGLPDVPVYVGGSAVTGHAHAAELGADGWSDTAQGGIELIASAAAGGAAGPSIASKADI